MKESTATKVLIGVIAVCLMMVIIFAIIMAAIDDEAVRAICLREK